MAKKTTGLAAFTRPKAGAEVTSLAAIEDDRLAVEIPTPRRKRGGGETVALTVKVRRSDWQRLPACGCRGNDNSSDGRGWAVGSAGTARITADRALCTLIR